MKKKTVACVVILFLCTVLIGLVTWLGDSYSTDESQLPTMEGCVLLKKNTKLFIYVDSDPVWNGVWSISMIDTNFISHNESLSVIDELAPGMMVQILAHDKMVDAIFPTPLREVEYIETWGEYNYELYNKGIRIYDGTQ